MHFRRPLQIAVFLLLSVMLSACSITSGQNDAGSHYSIRLVVIRADSEDYLEPLQHFLNTVHANVTVEALHIKQLQAGRLAGVDAVYPDPSILTAPEWQAERFTKLMQQYVAKGGHLFLEYPLVDHLPADFLGIAEWLPVETDELAFTYPTVSQDLIDLQTVYRAFAEGLSELKVVPLTQVIPKRAARLSTAASLVDINGASILAVNSYQAGTVTWADQLLPNRTYISRLDFMPNNPEQRFFHYGYTTANWLLRSKYLNLVAKQKYGFAIEKVLGAYHRPAIAWQNHFEVISSFAKQEIQQFTKLLRSYRQVPTFALIRGTFKWSHWAPSISWLPNIGTAEEPRYQGMLANSLYGTGQRLTMQDGTHLELGNYQGFSSLLGALRTPARAYPCVIDLNGDGRIDLLVGTPSGQVYYLPNQAASGPPVFRQQLTLATSKGPLQTPFAAPTAGDLAGDGLFDLVIGNQYGQLLVYHNSGTSSEPQFVHRQTLNLALGEYTAPCLVDWDGNGVLDLIVGVADGAIYLLPGQPGPQGITFGEAELLLATDLQWPAPCAADWDADGRLDLLIGSYDGQVALYQKQGATWLQQGLLQGESRNFFGNNNLNLGHNSVPVLVDWEHDGQVGLLLGGTEYGDPYALDDLANPARAGILASIGFLQENYLPILVHSYVHEFKSAAEEQEELALHRQAFIELGIGWNDMGINHHTWRINEHALQTFLAEQAAGICYDFGFHPFAAPGQPRDGKSFMPAVAPYRLTIGEEVQPFLLWAPVPDVQKYPLAYQSMQSFDLPLTYFDHVENRLAKGGQERANLVSTIEALARIQQEGNYSFMTEAQIAKSLFNHYYCRLDIGIEADAITLEADVSGVPAQAAEYEGAIGIRFLPGASLADANLSTDAWLRYRPTDTNDLYVGLLGSAKIAWGEEALPTPPLEILCANTPISVVSSHADIIELELKTTGMQQLVLRSAVPLAIRGEELLIDQAADIYTITHYGPSCRVTLIPCTQTP